MKIGDLVKHPAGMRNVCNDMYSMGIVLQVKRGQELHPRGETQVEVMWRGEQASLFYHKSQLEVISENR